MASLSTMHCTVYQYWVNSLDIISSVELGSHPKISEGLTLQDGLKTGVSLTL